MQLGTARFLDTFLPNPAEVPPGVVANVARQPGISEPQGLRLYATGGRSVGTTPPRSAATTATVTSRTVPRP